VFDLDNLAEMRARDPEDILRLIREIPEQMRVAWRNVSAFALPPHYAEVDNVVIMGMGGSAIAGDLLRTLVAGEARAPIEVVREYAVPAYVGPRTLAIASSYSGNTEETLAAFAGPRWPSSAPAGS
jgi:glucose/mannose-6-phosphate isomerase